MSFEKYSVYHIDFDNLYYSQKEKKGKFLICISVEDKVFLTINSKLYSYEKKDECSLLKKEVSFLKRDSFIRISSPIDITKYKYKNIQFKYRLSEKVIKRIKEKSLKSQRLQGIYKKYFK